ncbi:type II toxin-antitoxin system HicA family toxin [Actinoplanes sp. NPDC051411]|uniref:type II toxin-antitoxin system HicA family toxin n=1 Tax=Actinoplanes sp. NPDC051411 TaxID=3155522 RepID=UPI00341BC1A4
MRHPDGRGTTVPVHGDPDIAKGTLRGILSDVGMTIGQLAPRPRRAATSKAAPPDGSCIVVGEIRSAARAR